MNKNRFKFNNDLMLMNKEIIKQFAQEMPKQQQAKHTASPKTKPMTKGQIFEQKFKSTAK